MKVYLGADHRGFSLKQSIIEWLSDEEIVCEDLGNSRLDLNDDYPDFAQLVGQAVSQDSSGIGILLCGSGQGMCIAANKIRGVRASLIASIQDARDAKSHNHANIMCLSSKDQDLNDHIVEMIRTFLDTPYSVEIRHVRRVNKIAQIES